MKTTVFAIECLDQVSVDYLYYIHTYNKLLYTAIPSRSQRFVMMQRIQTSNSNNYMCTYKNKSIWHGFRFDLGFTAKNGKIQSCPKHNIEYVFWARILCRIHFWSQKCKICYSFLNININVESCASDGSQNMRPTSSDSI